jgi:hypothetical protein
MAGALLQLVAYGAQDLYITGQPQITFWKTVYRRYTNFAKEDIEMLINGDTTLGSRFTVTVPRSADLLGRIWFEVLLDNPISTDAYRLGFQLIDNVEIEIGGQTIDKHYGHWMDIWAQLTLSSEELTKLNYMLSAQIEPPDGNGRPNDAQRKVYIPLQFWFCNNPGLALPLIALQYHEVKLNVQLNDRIVVTTNNSSGQETGYTNVTATTGRIVQLPASLTLTLAAGGAWPVNAEQPYTYTDAIPTADTTGVGTQYLYTCDDADVVGNNFVNIGLGQITVDATNVAQIALADDTNANATAQNYNITFYTKQNFPLAQNIAATYNANVLTVTSNSHGLVNGNQIDITAAAANAGGSTPAQAAVLVAVSNATVTRIDDNTFSIPITLTDGNGATYTISYQGLDVIRTSAALTITNQPAIVISSIRVWGEYIFLDTDERRRFAQMSHEYLIEQTQFGNTYGTGDERANNIELRFNHPCKTLVVAVQDSNVGTTRHPFDHFRENTGMADCVQTLGLQFNGSDRFKVRDGTYFRTVQLYDTFAGGYLQTPAIDATDDAPIHPCGGFYTYNFALRPGEHQPSGTCNFSRIDSAVLLLTFPTGLTGTIKVYAVNYNILRVVSGMAGVAYSN